MVLAEQYAVAVSAPSSGPVGAGDPAVAQTVAVGPTALTGRLVLGARPMALVVLVRCVGARNGHADTNGFVAETFRRHRLATLSLTLLTDDETADEHRRSDVQVLARRVGEALQWIAAQPGLAAYRCALFGAGIGGAALLLAAAAMPARIDALVTRGARLDLAWPSLRAVRAPTLLIAGSEAAVELQRHSAALRELQCEKRLEVIPGAALLFQDAGVIETVAELSASWLTAHLGGRGSA